MWAACGRYAVGEQEKPRAAVTPRSSRNRVLPLPIPLASRRTTSSPLSLIALPLQAACSGVIQRRNAGFLTDGDAVRATWEGSFDRCHVHSRPPKGGDRIDVHRVEGGNQGGREARNRKHDTRAHERHQVGGGHAKQV